VRLPPRFLRGKSPQDDLNLEDRPDTALEGHLAIESILNWPMQPLAHRGEPGQAAAGGLSRLSVEIDQLSQEWAAYQSGHLHRGEALVAAAGEGPPPLDPWRTARAASLLVRVVRHFSEGLPLRRLLEPLTQELLEAVYRDWQATESLSALEGASLEAFLEKPTHYAVLRGHLEITREARERAAKAEAEAEAHRQRAAPREEELEEERRKVLHLEAELAAQRAAREESDRKAAKAVEGYNMLKRRTKIALQDFEATQLREATALTDIRTKEFEILEKDRHLRELNKHSMELNAKVHHLEKDVWKARTLSEDGKKALEQLPGVLFRLEKFEANEAVAGVDFAQRVAAEVLDTTMEALCGGQLRLPAGNSAKDRAAETRSKAQRKAALDTVINKLRGLPTAIKKLEAQVQKLRNELQDTRKFVPVWNADAVEDLQDAYDLDAPIHRQVVFNSTQRAFAALGTGSGVPPFLRAQGLVRSVELPKEDLLSFVRDFWAFLDEDADVQNLTPKSLHTELHQFLKSRYEGDEQTVFAYAFVSQLKAHSDEPECELMDLLLSGVVHCSILQDQNDLFRGLQSLLLACQDGPVEKLVGVSARPPSAHASPRSKRPQRLRSKIPAAEDPASTDNGLQDHDAQVSRRIARAVLQAVFPDKPQDRQNSLRRALHATLRQLADEGKAPAQDCAMISDLFQAPSRGSSTSLRKEIMRQHYREVIEFSAKLAQQLRAPEGTGRSTSRGEHGADRESVNSQVLRAALTALEPRHRHLDRLVKLGCPESTASVDILEVHRRLRHGILLRPENLWVQPEPTSVLEQLLGVGSDSSASEEAQGRSPAGTVASGSWTTRPPS